MLSYQTVVRRLASVFGLLTLAAAASAQQPKQPLRIWPLGDSITWGFQFTAPRLQIPGGYRAPLQATLANAGYTVSFVGSGTENPCAPLLPYAASAEEGHPGYRSDQILNNLFSTDGTPGNNGGYWVSQIAAPDVILLHVGTNDLIQDTAGLLMPNLYAPLPTPTAIATNLQTLIDKLTTTYPNAHVIVAAIIPINNVNPGFNANDVNQVRYQAYLDSLNPQVVNYDGLIPKVVAGFAAQGRNVTFVDQYHNFLKPDGTVNASLLPDNIHPNRAGYAMMAGTWAQAILSLYPTPPPAPETSDPVAAFSFAAPRAGYGTPSFNYGHYSLGYSFTPQSNVNVTALGFYDAGQDGLRESHQVGLYDSTGHLLTSATVTSWAPLEHLFRYTSITPVLLRANQTYYIAATTGGEEYVQQAVDFQSSPLVRYGTSGYTSSDVLAMPTQHTSAYADPAWFGPNFKVTAAN